MGEVVLASCSDDRGVFATDLWSGAVVGTYEEAPAEPHAFGVIGDVSSHVFAVQANKALWHAWAWGDKKPCYRASLPEKMTAMTFTNDASLCFGGSVTGCIYVWQMGTGCLLKFWSAHFREVSQLLVSQDRTFLVSASADANVHVYNLADIFAEQVPRPFHTWSGHALPVTSLALLPGSGLQQTVASASLDRSVRLWDIGTGRPLAARTLPAAVHSICGGPNSTDLLCACGNGELHSFGLSSALGEDSARYVGHVGAVLSCALSADGSRVASCTKADRVRIWETRTRQCITQVHTSRNVEIGAVKIVQRAAFAPTLPPFQPFQRLLTEPENVPPVPVSLGSRGSTLKEAVEAHGSTRDFVDRLFWLEGGGAQDLKSTKELQVQLEGMQAAQARWAATATDLYDALVESGLDAQEEPPTSRAPGTDATGATQRQGKKRKGAARQAGAGSPDA